MMDWQIQRHVATLGLPALKATVDLARPQDGLTNLAVRERTWSDVQLLGVVVESGAVNCAELLADSYARQGDLVATYAQTADRPTRVQIYWRAGALDHAMVDLQVSLQTSLLDAAAAIVAQSRIRAAHVYRLTQASSGTFDEVPAPKNGCLSITPDSGPGCLLFRLPGNGTSYVEMIHPADFHEAIIERQSDGALRLNHRLFVSSLEKGVILRARMRGVFLPRENDLSTAAAAYREFVDSKLPLTT